MVPLLVPEVFSPVDFSMQAHVFFIDTWYHPYISTCFCGKRFYFPYNYSYDETIFTVLRPYVRMSVPDRTACIVCLYMSKLPKAPIYILAIRL